MVSCRFSPQATALPTRMFSSAINDRFSSSRSLVGVRLYYRSVVIGGSVFVGLGMTVLVLVGLAVVVGADCTMFLVVLDSEVMVHGVVAVCVVNHTVPPMAILKMDWPVVVEWATTFPTVKTGAMGIARSVLSPIPEGLVGRDLSSSARV